MIWRSLAYFMFFLTSCALFGQSANPNQVALLRWYPANTVTQFKLGALRPVGVAFDGQNIWVVSNADQAVSKIRASDGSLLGTFHVGNQPSSIAFDGANMRG